MRFVAQTMPQNEGDWKFWVMAVIACLTIFQTIVQPLIGWTMKQVLNRLRAGDEKFDVQGRQLAVLETKMENVIDSNDSQTKSLNGLVEKINNTFIEGSGSVAELRVTIERDFVRKAEIQRLEQKTDDQHREVMAAIHGLKGGR